jgi:hypothetical protein
MTFRAAGLAISCALSILTSCGDAFVRERVAGIEFCVPRENFVDTEYWWIPADLPKGDGFRFRVHDFFGKRPALHPNRNVKGRDIGLGGQVTSRPEYFNWSRPHSKSQPFKEAQTPVQDAKRIAGSYFSIDTSTESKSWHVWEVDDWSAPSVGAKPVAEAGRLIATCRKYGETLRNAYIGTSCNRIFILDGVAVRYSFSDENLPNLAMLDAEIGKQILAWRCADGGAGP